MDTVGRYQLIQKLATGGMAEVFLARAEGPMGFQKKLVVKRILPHLADDPLFVQMFLNEAKLAAQLEHPNIIQVFDFGQAGKDFFLAMEFIDGFNLRGLNVKARTFLGAMPHVLCARLVSLACEGLAYAHALKDPETGKPLNLIHRDISPDNIMVSRTGAVKVADFGIARVETQSHKTKSGVLKGKLAYMPPEQLTRMPLDKRVDVYALGVVLYELLCGVMPFDATSEVSIIQAVMSSTPLTPIGEKRTDVPHALARIVGRALEKDRDARYPDVRALQVDLDRFIQDTGEVVGPSEISEYLQTLDEAQRSAEEEASPLADALAERAEVGLEPTRQSASGASAHAAAGDLLGKTEASDPGRPRTSGALRRTGTDELQALVRPARPLWPLLVGFVVLGAGGAVLAMRLLRPPPEAVEAAVDAGSAVEAPAADAGPAVDPVPVPPLPVAVDAGLPVVPVAPVDAGAAAVREPVQPRRPVVVEFRVRPFANVWFDGKLLGEAPGRFPLPPGRQKVTLENPKYGKVTLEVLVKPGAEVRHNFRD